MGKDAMGKRKTGIVLEGGAMRGLFTAGVLDVLMENSLYPDGLVGVSAGAAFGCNMKSRQNGRVIRYNKRFCKDPRYCSWRSLFLTGDLFGADFCYRKLPEELDIFDKETFEKNPMEFFLVCTDTESGEAIYRKCEKADERCYDWMRASASMPIVSRAVRLEGKKYLDGAISDAVPLRFFQEKGYERNIVVLTRGSAYRKKPQKGMWLLQILLYRYPAILQKMKGRHIAYNDTLAYIKEQEQKGSVFLIQPQQELPIDRICHDPLLLQKTYDMGRQEAERRLPALREFLLKE